MDEKAQPKVRIKIMERFFNNAGPCVAEDHYIIDPLKRIDLPHIERLIAQKRYFVLHAPRQTGKTTSLFALMAYLNAQGRYHCLYADIEAAQALRGDVAKGMYTVVMQIAQEAAFYLNDARFKVWAQEAVKQVGAENALNELLSRWVSDAKKPVVLLLDEVDTLIGDTLIALLRQIRTGYGRRPKGFPQSIILCGVRDVRDYRIHTSQREIITGGSAFNIKAESLRLGNFTQDEVDALYGQHTRETGQRFASDIFPELWEDTRGQPWLVNALGYEMTWRDDIDRDRSISITLERYRAARERLIQSRATHLDQLIEKLKEARVHRVIAPLLAGEGESADAGITVDDQEYVADLGLIEIKPQERIANRIYQEVIPRELIAVQQSRIAHQTAWYVMPDHTLGMVKLLAAFQQFFREHSESWIERFDYKEAGPQLLLQAFLQRIVNGGGRINREYGLGRKRTDLLLEWPLDSKQGYLGPIQRVVIELKILHKSLELTLQKGLEQTADYAQRCNADEAHLIVFNRRKI